jgi:hypothetical protein
MLETIRQIISCKLCEKILERPVLLPCGETICFQHEYLFKNQNTARCKLCETNHELGESEHFPSNKGLERLLENEIRKLDLGKHYKETVKLLEELKSATVNLYSNKKNPGDLIFESFQAMRRKVDLVREAIIKKANDCSEKIISDINAYKAECQLNQWRRYHVTFVA